MAESRGVGLLERPRSLPDGLASMPPGPQLAAALASVDRSAVTAEDLPDLVRARARLLAYEQAEFLRDLVEAVRGAAAEPGSTTRYDDEQRQDDATVELGWALRWSQAYTQVQVKIAQDLVNRLPMVLDALRAGRLDRERASAFADALQHVDDAIARTIATKLVDRAEAWTLAQLRDKLRYHIDRADPQAKRRRYRKAVTDRGVWLYANDDGTANLTGVNLPPHRAAAAFDRLDRLARAARRDGDPRTLPQLRADAFTDLLTGTPFQLSPTTDPITAHADTEAQPKPEPHQPEPENPNQPRQPEPDLPPPQQPAPNPTGDHPDQPRGPSQPDGDHADQPNQPDQPDGDPPSEPDPSRIDLYDYDRWCLTDRDRWWLHRLHTTDDPDIESPDTDANLDLDGFAGAPLPGDRCACGGLLPPRRPAGADVQIELTTLLGLDDHPALITGTGPVPAELARFIAHDPTTNPVWRWSVYDPDGHLRHHGYTTHRPTTDTPTTNDHTTCNRTTGSHTTGRDATGREAGGHTAGGASGQRWCRCVRYDAAQRRGTVELLLTTSILADLVAHPHRAPGYQNVIADIAHQVQHDTPPETPSTPDTTNTTPNPDHTGRHPTAAEAAFIRARDRSCRTPNCRKPATACEIDHRIEYAKGGPSHRGNCECRCRRHHTLRHRTGYTITKHDHTTIWTTRNGRTYPVPPDKDITPTNEP